ncbi:hypothetical protein [Nocardioides daphniae]|uniref:Uncharacterized protein n=1 Tax=Nocardioides daphniae TaxID=402297 RepID=A0A4P7UBR0_9ACTN|nr:hypothetical protein [Nocardioides daphniae]QCC77550.1 hypothetical protein E2C04_10855 [Nocardioides daphniae]GGD30869.1 hypothetical protein GCM10007231_32980 [Nocardioides daphniae]
MNFSSRRAYAALVLAAGAVACSSGPAVAHPFGEPQTLDLSLQGSQVTLVWQAAADDYTSLAMRLGAVEGPRRMVYRDGAMTPETVDSRDAQRLAESPALADYLLSTVRVAQDGQPCEGRLVTPVDLASGATLTYACPDVVGSVEVTAAPLVDLHPAYTTLATGPGGATHVFSADSSAHTFDAEVGGPTLARSALTLGAVATAGTTLAGGWWVLRRRARAGRA